MQMKMQIANEVNADNSSNVIAYAICNVQYANANPQFLWQMGVQSTTTAINPHTKGAVSLYTPHMVPLH